MLKVLDLFSGIGGFSLGLERTGGFETVAFCEIDSFCQKVLKKHWPDVPIYNDVRNLQHDGSVDVITGGYPCQPFSTAGKRQGATDDRHLWPAMFGLIEKYRPDWIIGENVAGHVSMGLDNVLSDLEGSGYAARTFIVPACAVDAKHRRDRTWIVANSKSAGKRREVGNICETHGVSGGTLLQQPDRAGAYVEISECSTQGGGRVSRSRKNKEEMGGGASDKFLRTSKTISDTSSPRRKEQHSPALSERAGIDPWSTIDGWGAARWEAEPAVGRVANGIPRRVDRLRSLGNAVVPQIPEIIGYAILAAEAYHD